MTSTDRNIKSLNEEIAKAKSIIAGLNSDIYRMQEEIRQINRSTNSYDNWEREVMEAIKQTNN